MKYIRTCIKFNHSHVAVSHGGREEGKELARGREGRGEAREVADGAEAVGLGLPELGRRGRREQTGKICQASDSHKITSHYLSTGETL